MKPQVLSTGLLSLFIFASLLARAQEPKWLQPPDLSEWGMDVECMKERPILLADDFACKSTGPITNIVVWGSWLNDKLPFGGEPPVLSPTNVMFTLSIHADIPAGQQALWSMPGEILWWTNVVPGGFAVAIEEEGLQEGWYDPATTNYHFPGDTVCWRYTFAIEPVRAFVQTGTVENPVIYWLDVQAQPMDMTGESRFGWKTTTNQWNDAACWVPEVEPYGGFAWQFLQYPPGHQLYDPEITNGFDLAFAIESGSGGQEEYPVDFGDAPDSVQLPRYPTLAANNGAYHVITNTLLLGSSIDGEPDGQPTLAADGDDINGVPDDEDGIQFISGLYAGMDASIRVKTIGSGLISAWIDANADGDWDDPGEKVIGDLPLITGVHNLAFKVPPMPPGPPSIGSFIRFRYSTQPGLTVRGGANDGEVEDYAVTILDSEDADMDLGDAPPIYPVLRIQDGARHVAAAGAYIMGTQRDTEPDGNPAPQADGDDMTGVVPDDEDGVFLPTNSLGQAMLLMGSNMTINVVTPGSPWLSAWIDFDGDGNWGGAGEVIAAGTPLLPGSNPISVTAPFGGALGTTYARFRTSSIPGPLAVTGAAPDGEVEDYALMIMQPSPVSPADISITNVTTSGGTGIWVRWSCDVNLMTQPLACTNLIEASTNPAAWMPLAMPGLAQQYLDAAGGSSSSRFYRVVAPYVLP